MGKRSYRYMRVWLFGAASTAIFMQTAHAANVIDDFESYAVGSFPTPTWLDVSTVKPEPSPYVNAPVPSASVVTTTDAHGHSTQALQTVDALGVSKGIYTPVPVSSHYSLFADLKTVRYANTTSDPSYSNPASDWSMQLTFAQTGITNFDSTPQAGVYASSQTQGWRLFLISSNNGPSADIDLGVAAQLGTWYSVSLDIDASNGAFHSIISDTASGAVLSDVTNHVAGWDPTFANFDSIAFFAGETLAADTPAAFSTTIPNIGMVDNINVATTPVPLPAPFLMLLSGLGAGALRRRAVG